MKTCKTCNKPFADQLFYIGNTVVCQCLQSNKDYEKIEDMIELLEADYCKICFDQDPNCPVH